MLRLLIIDGDETGRELALELGRAGFSCHTASDDRLNGQSPDLVLAKLDGRAATEEMCRRLKQERGLPVIGLVTKRALDRADGFRNVDDFAIEPYHVKELVLRIDRLLGKTQRQSDGEQIRRGDLVIDLAKCEVSVGGRLIELTFKEYELLKLLAANRGRVYSRQALLDKVWGYDYFGGDRTVDVHVRRLRSKIEDSTHIFIETVRNIGYRFRKEA